MAGRWEVCSSGSCRPVNNGGRRGCPSSPFAMSMPRSGPRWSTGPRSCPNPEVTRDAAARRSSLIPRGLFLRSSPPAVVTRATLAAPGEWIWSSLLAQDPDKDAAFYQTLFGYDVFDVPSDDGLDHVILSTDDYARASVNALPSHSSRRHPHWLNFVRVVDAVDAAAKAVALGGRVLVEPHVDRHGGKVAIVADPTGAPFGLMEWSDTDSRREPK